jgi:hypothetical protein
VKEAACAGVAATKDVGVLVEAASCKGIEATKDAESRLQRDLNTLTIAMLNGFSDAKTQALKAELKAEYEAKLNAQLVIKELTANAQHNAERTQDKTAHSFEEVQEKLEDCCCEIKEKFCALDKDITSQFVHAREEELENELDEVRQEKQTADIIAALSAKKV